jgi:aryl-alcohol dehydrogenase-like predicted oxidoreductase
VKHVRLGKPEVGVSNTSLGIGAYGGEWGTFDGGEPKATLRLALDLGINLIDTARPTASAGPNMWWRTSGRRT